MTRLVLAAGVAAMTTGSAFGQYCEDVDLVHDGVLNVFDIVAMFQLWNEQDLAADFTGDGVVSGLDLGYQIAHPYGDGLGCLALPAFEGAGFLVVEDVTDEVEPDPGLKAYDVFLTLFAPEHILVSVFDANLECDQAGCFVGPPFGSYLTIGAEPHFNPDINYDMDAFMAGTSVGVNAGWWGLPFEDPPGLAGNDAMNRVQIARFIMDEKAQIAGELSFLVLMPGEDEPLVWQETEVVIPAGGCYADFNDDGELNILDFVAYQNAFTAGDPQADCNGCGVLNILDFVCFQQKFLKGCD